MKNNLQFEFLLLEIYSFTLTSSYKNHHFVLVNNRKFSLCNKYYGEKNVKLNCCNLRWLKIKNFLQNNNYLLSFTLTTSEIPSSIKSYDRFREKRYFITSNDFFFKDLQLKCEQ